MTFVQAHKSEGVDSRRRRLRHLSAVAALCLVSSGCSTLDPPELDSEQAEALELGWSPVEPLAAKRPPGDPISGPRVSDGWDDGLVLVNVWGSFCGPCVKELPLLQAVSTEPGINVVGVTLDQNEDYALQALDAAGVTYSNFSDPSAYWLEEFSSVVPVQALPSSMILKGGDVVAVHIGPFESRRDFTYLKRYLP